MPARARAPAEPTYDEARVTRANRRRCRAVNATEEAADALDEFVADGHGDGCACAFCRQDCASGQVRGDAAGMSWALRTFAGRLGSNNTARTND